MTQPDVTGVEDVSPDVGAVLADFAATARGYEAAREYDDINLWEQFADSRAGRTLREADIEFEPNFCGVVIDAVANRLEITTVTAATGDSDKPSDEATALVNEVWDANELGSYLPQWHRNALRDGDGYIMAWPRPGAEVSDEGRVSAPDDINITFVDPLCGRMFYDPANERIPRLFGQLWHEPYGNGFRWRMNLLYPDRIERYVTARRSKLTAPKVTDFERYNAPETPADQEPDEQAGQWPQPNPYNRIPVWHLRTALPYGKPEHRNAFALQDALSKLIEMLMVTVEAKGYPQEYGLQEMDAVRSPSIREDPLADSYGDGLDADPLTSAVAGDPAMTDARMERGPRNMLLFKNLKDVGAFDAADPNAFLDPWREIAKAISTTTDTPAWKFHGLGIEVPSGVALRVGNEPLNKKTSDRQRLFGTADRGVLEFALFLLGVDARVTLTWAPAATPDPVEAWTLVAAMVAAGVPRKDAFMAAGVPEQQAEEWAVFADALPAEQWSIRRPGGQRAAVDA